MRGVILRVLVGFGANQVVVEAGNRLCMMHQGWEPRVGDK